MTTAAFALLGVLSGGLSLQLTALTPDVTVGGEVHLRVVLRADRHTELTPALCGRLGERAAITIRREGPDGARGLITFIIQYEGLASNPVLIWVRER